MRLKDKVAIVTGGAHGMGEAEARLFAAEGARVVVADVLRDQTDAVAADIPANGGDSLAVTIDVTSEPEWVVLIGKRVSTYGRLDILVNNAGAPQGADRNEIEDVPVEAWDRTMGVNAVREQPLAAGLVQRGEV